MNRGGTGFSGFFYCVVRQGPVLHCGVFRCSEKRNFEKQIDHLLCDMICLLSSRQVKYLKLNVDDACISF